MHFTIFRLDKLSLVNKRDLNIDEDGHVVDMHFFDTGKDAYFISSQY